MKTEKIFTPIIAVGLAVSLSVGSEIEIPQDGSSNTNLTSGSNSIKFLGTSGSFSGEINANNGSTNQILFTQDGSFNFDSILTTDSNSQNIFTIDKNITLETSGLIINAEASQPTITPSTSGTFFKIADNSSLSLINNAQKGSITTNSGEATISFEGTSGSFSGEIIADFSSKSGRNNITFASDGTFGFDAILHAKGGYNTLNIDHNIAINTDIYSKVSGSEDIDKGNSFLIAENASLSLKDEDTKKSLYTQSGETYIEFGSQGSFTGNFSTSGGALEIAFKIRDNTKPINIDLDSSFYATQEGKNLIRFWGQDQIATFRNDIGFFFSGDETGKNIIFVGASGSGLSFQNSSQTTQTLTYEGGDNYIVFGNSNQTFEGNIHNSKGSITFLFGCENEKDPSTPLIGKATINGKITANGGNNAFSFLYDDSTLSLGDGSQIIANSTSTNTFTIDKNVVFLTDISFSGDNISGSGGNIININADKSLTLSANNTTKTILTTSGSTYINLKGDDAILDGNISTSGGKTIVEFYKNGTLASGLDTSGGEMTINLYGSKGVIEGEITTTGKGKSHIVFNQSDSTFILKDNATLTSVSNLKNHSKAYGSNNGISFYHDQRSGEDFKTLTIGTKGSSTDGINGDGLNFVIYATTNEVKTESDNSIYSDKIIIHSSSNAGSSTHNLGVRFENQDTINLDAITYTKGGDNNILVASVAKSSKVNFNTQESLVLGFDVANVQYTKEDTDENGIYQANGAYTSYFIGSARVTDIVVAEQEITATTFTLNYDLYMANFNSLNKRMGELRENTHSQGVWARVFNGALSNDFGLGSKSNYTTIQAGYDYAFGFEGANNYLGLPSLMHSPLPQAIMLMISMGKKEVLMGFIAMPLR